MDDDLIGKSLGQFEILDEIGRGGMATVYRARQTSINRTVAIKVLPRSLLHDPTFYERFIREVDLVAHLEHPHILPIYDYGEVDGVPYIAMRYLAGGSMAQWIRRGLPPLDRIAKPVEQVASALDYAHQEGVIHRDLKPGNILLDENSNAYLSDFGIARVLDSNLTGSAIVGTPAYMSPEQANGLPLDARSDIYSLGVVLFELVTGREPYEAETPVALLLKHINEPMPSARGLRPNLPPAADYVIVRATAKQPDQRYASAADMAEAWATALHRPAAIEDDNATLLDAQRPAEPTRVAEPRTPTPVPAVPPPEPTLATPKRRTLGWIAALLVVIVIAAVAGIILLTPRSAPPPATPPPAPTPFANAYTVQRSLYTISVPEGWKFTDLSNDFGTVHMWQLDTRAYVAIWVIDKTKLTNPGATADFNALVDSFDTEVVSHMDGMQFIDGTTAEDGSVRRSYRYAGAEGAFPAGQTDVFYLDRGKYIAVVETYCSGRGK